MASEDAFPPAAPSHPPAGGAEQLAKLHGLQSLGELAAGVAHEFHNLMAVVTGGVEYLSQLSPETALGDPDVADCLRDTSAAALRASELTERLAQLAGSARAAHPAVDASAVVQDCGPLLQRAFGDAVDVQVCTEPGVGVHADSAQLSQLVMSLCANARQAMPEGGRLTLTLVGKGGGVDGQAYAELGVRDTGVGMDETTREQAFVPFFTTRGEHGAMGLGLFQARNLVRRLGGEIRLRSRPGQGTQVRVRLPRALQEAAPHGPAIGRRSIEDEEGKPRSAPRVLLVEDDALVRRGSRRYLCSRGYAVLEAGSGQAGLELFRRNHARLDAVLLDLGLPHMRGEEVLARLRQINPAVPVVVYSGHWEHERVKGVLAAGASSFLRKPAHGGALERALRAVIPAARRVGADGS